MDAGTGRLTSFKVVPSPHRDLAAVKFSLVFQARLLGLFARRLARVAPAEVIKLPVRVRREHEIPNGERKQVDEHPRDVGPSVGRHDDENGGQTQNEGQ